MTRRIHAFGLVAVASGCLVSAVPVAEASFPGRNGLIAFATEGPAFNRAREGPYTIRVVNPSSGRTRQLTHVPSRCGRRGWTWDDSQPSFSASGRLLVYVHWDECDPRTRDGIYTMRADGSRRRLIRPTDPDPDLDELPEYPAFSPSGRYVAFDQYLGYSYLVRVPRPGERPLFSCYSDPRCNDLLFPRYTNSAQPAWSTTGRLALSLSGVDGYGDAGHIGIAPSPTRETYQRLPRLVTHGNTDAKPDWSPGSARIVFERQKITRGPILGDVFVAPADTKRHRRPRRLTQSRDAFFPVWSPDGRQIAYVRDTNAFLGPATLWLMRAAGGGRRLVATAVSTDRISWQPRPRR